MRAFFSKVFIYSWHLYDIFTSYIDYLHLFCKNMDLFQSLCIYFIYRHVYMLISLYKKRNVLLFKIQLMIILTSFMCLIIQISSEIADLIAFKNKLLAWLLTCWTGYPDLVLLSCRWKISFLISRFFYNAINANNHTFPTSY